LNETIATNKTPIPRASEVRREPSVIVVSLNWPLFEAVLSLIGIGMQAAGRIFWGALAGREFVAGTAGQAIPRDQAETPQVYVENIV
jgi:hypothetical protein